MKHILIPFAVMALAAPLTASADETIDVSADKVVYDLPAGTVAKNYLREGELFRKWGSDAIKKESISATLTPLAESEDGKVYISNALSNGAKGYLVGVREGDKVTFSFPQILEKDDSYVAVMRLEPTTIEVPGYSDETPIMYRPSYKIFDGPQEIVFNIENGNFVQTTDAYFGFVKADGSWGGYGEYNQVYTPFDGELVVCPDDAEPFNVAMKYESTLSASGDPGIYSLISGARSGNDLYLKGLSQQYPDSYIKGTINGDRITFESGQFLGIGGWSVEYFCAGIDKPEFIPGYNEWEHHFSVTSDIEMAYDATTGVISALDEHDTFILTPSQVAYVDGLIYMNPSLAPQPDVIDPTPIMPLFKRGVNQWDNGIEPLLTFQVRPLNIYGQLLDKNNIGFVIDVEGEPYVFNEWDYWLYEDMTIIPWGTNEPFIEMAPNGWTLITFRDQYLRDVKIRTVNTVDGVEYYSDYQSPDNPVVQDPISGVVVVEASDSPVIVTEYYDLKGNRVQNPVKGFYITRDLHEDGTVSHNKIII